MSSVTIQAPELAQNVSAPLESLVRSSELDLAPKELAAPIYKYRRLIQSGNGAGNVLSLQQSSTTQSMFVLPGSMVFNPAKSFVTMDLGIAAPTNYNHFFVDSVPIDSIVLQTDTGTELAKVLNAQPYTKVMQALCTDLDEYESRGPVYGDIAANTLFPVSPNSGCQPVKTNDSDNAAVVPLYPCNNYLTNASVAATGVYSSGGRLYGLGAITIQTNAAPRTFTIAAVDNCIDSAGALLSGTIINVTAQSDNNGDTPTVGIYRVSANVAGAVNVLTGAFNTGIAIPMVAINAGATSGTYTSTAATNNALRRTAADSNGKVLAASGISDALAQQHVVAGGVLFVRCRFPLKAFVGTILSMDKNLYFGQNLQLYINWAQTNRWGFDGTLAGASATGLGANAAAPITVSNYYLWVAEDVNQENTEPLKMAVQSAGQVMLVPWTNSNTLSVAGSANSSFSYPVQLNPGTGVALQRCVIVPILQSNSLASSNNNDNVNSTKYQYVQSFIDSKPLQDIKLNDQTDDVYNWLYPLIKKTPLGISDRAYHINNFWVDDFAHNKSAKEWRYYDNYDAGMQIDMPRQYNVEFTQSAASGPNLTLCGYQTWMRRLAIKPNGTAWVA